MSIHPFITRQGDTTIYSRLFVCFSRRPSQILRDPSSVLLFRNSTKLLLIESFHPSCLSSKSEAFPTLSLVDQRQQCDRQSIATTDMLIRVVTPSTLRPFTSLLPSCPRHTVSMLSTMSAHTSPPSPQTTSPPSSRPHASATGLSVSAF
jgi:hypothetical protein